MKVPMGMFGLATGVAAFPTLARLAAGDRPREAFDVIVRAGRAVLVLAFVSQAVLTVAGEDIATIIWGTERFDAFARAEIGALTGVFSVGLAGWALQGLLARGFYAMGNTWVPSVLGTVVMIGSVPLYMILGREWGAMGLACASSSAIIVYVVVLALVLRRRIGGHRARAFAPIIGPLLIACAAGIVAGTGLREMLAAPPVASALASSLTAGTVAILVSRWLRVDEIGELGAAAIKLIRNTRRPTSS